MFGTEDLEKQRKITGSNVPWKMIFENNALPTTNKNTILDVIALTDSKSEDKKKRTRYTK
jgi:hypothetical protein